MVAGLFAERPLGELAGDGPADAQRQLLDVREGLGGVEAGVGWEGRIHPSADGAVDLGGGGWSKGHRGILRKMGNAIRPGGVPEIENAADPIAAAGLPCKASLAPPTHASANARRFNTGDALTHEPVDRASPNEDGLVGESDRHGRAEGEADHRDEYRSRRTFGRPTLAEAGEQEEGTWRTDSS